MAGREGAGPAWPYSALRGRLVIGSLWRRAVRSGAGGGGEGTGGQGELLTHLPEVAPGGEGPVSAGARPRCRLGALGAAGLREAVVPGRRRGATAFPTWLSLLQPAPSGRLRLLGWHKAAAVGARWWCRFLDALSAGKGEGEVFLKCFTKTG